MKKLLFMLLLLPVISWGQDKTISGVITDGAEPLPGVNIIEKGSVNGVTTDFNGNFEISVSPDAVLEFSYIGFSKQEIVIGDQTTLNVTMQEDTHQLEGVVVQGFAGVVGRARKRTESVQSIPESVTALNAEGIENNGINNVTDFQNSYLT